MMSFTTTRLLTSGSCSLISDGNQYQSPGDDVPPPPRRRNTYSCDRACGGRYVIARAADAAAATVTLRSLHAAGAAGAAGVHFRPAAVLAPRQQGALTCGSA